MDPQPVQRHAEVGQAGERGLLRRPVEPVGPVGDELARLGPAEVVRRAGQSPVPVWKRMRPFSEMTMLPSARRIRTAPGLPAVPLLNAVPLPAS